MKMPLAIPAVAVFLTISAAQAQSTAVRAADVPSKIGIVNMQQIIAGTAEGKHATAELQSQFAPRQTELENLQKQIADDEMRLRAGQTTLSDEERGRVQREIEKLNQTLQRKQQYYQEDTTTAEQNVVDSIGKKAVDVLNKYRMGNSFAVILDTSSQQTTVVSFDIQIDITQDIIRIYDQTYPVKAAAEAAPKPATPKPATPAKPQQ
jgi:outer membrane protein